MTRIYVQEDCGNAPKKQFIKDFCIANANADIKAAMNMVTDNICLEVPSYETAQGKDAIQSLLRKDAKRSKVVELTIDNILSHGDRGAANGILKFEDGGIVAFCNMYTFDSHGKNAKLKLIQVYSINIR